MSCPDLETLYLRLLEGDPEAEAHLESCPRCAAALEADRQLEKDLFRLVDPLPPPDFVQQVMARVENAPASLREVKLGLVILLVSAGLLVASLFALPQTAAQFGSHAAGALVLVQRLVLGFGDALGALWHVAALPLVSVAGALLLACLAGLRRFAGNFSLSEAKVS
jgi:anti-sigma factor RsiW